jgi:hypothetical protein
MLFKSNSAIAVIRARERASDAGCIAAIREPEAVHGKFHYQRKSLLDFSLPFNDSDT